MHFKGGSHVLVFLVDLEVIGISPVSRVFVSCAKIRNFRSLLFFVLFVTWALLIAPVGAAVVKWAFFLLF